MASSVANTTVSPPAAQDRRTVQVIERQLGRARFHVKLIDLLCHAALLAVGALVYLLVAALADHWLLPGGLGFTGRALAFVGLVALMAWFMVSYLGPLFLRGINPTYAARTIEEAQPSLKNSLINFLLLRQDRGGVREAVFDAVEQKAAADIATVQVESAVDRAPVIRLGYVLVGVLALFAAYKILSPKDPFQTAARVAMPWADIARPSRVQILTVMPGTAKVYHGHTVPVTATINGTSEDSPVWLVYSTADGQTVDRKLRMKSRPGGIQFKAQLPPEDSQSPAIKPGLQQDVIYRVEAGDAVTEDYRLTVVAAPTIVVQQLEYEFPAYTNKSRQTLDKQGDIQALEGTKVTIHALANQPIETAFIELDPDDSPLGAAEMVPLQFDGQRAWGTISLQLRKDRVTPWRTSYQVRFTNADGNKSEQPIRHQIDVLRDLPPEVQILAPSEKRIEVPENGSRPVEVRGIDPDFGLTRLALLGEVRGKQILQVELLKDDGTHPPQAVAKFVFAPQQHGLKAGDELVYHALAADNRTSPTSDSPDPNVTTTRPQVIVIVAPQERSPQQDEPQPMENEKPQPADDKRPMPMENQPDNADQEKQPKTDQPKEGEKCPEPMEGAPQNQGEKGEKSQNPMQGSKGEKDKSSGKNNQKSEGQKTDAQDSDQTGAEGSSDKGAKGQSQPGGGKSGEKSSGSPEQESPTDAAAGESSEGSPMGSPSGNAAERAGKQGDQAGDNAGDPTGTSDQPTRPAHDGDAIERILKHRQEQEKQSGPPGTKRDGTGDAPQDATDAPSETDPREPMPGEKTGNKTGSAEPRPQPGTEKTDQTKADRAKGEKGAQQVPQKPDDAQGEGTAGQKNEKVDKTGKQPQPAADEEQNGQPGEKTQPDGVGEKTKGGQPGLKKEPGEKDGAGADKKDGEGDAKNDAGAKGGNPQGPMKTDKGDQPQPGEKGEKKEPGMGKTGQSGAGEASKDEKGSGDSQEAGRDRKKDMEPDSTQPKDSDPSTPANSKRQSDSAQGNDSGDKSGAGKKGAGQPAKQAGNDTAGQNSPGDEGAGTANEKGKGPTGDKGGDQKKADGQTGAKGSEKGDGSTGKNGKGEDALGSTPPPGAKAPDSKSDGSKGQNSQDGGGDVPLGGGAGRRPSAQPGEAGEVPDSDDANLEYAKKQTELALEYLKDQEHNPDPELLDRLGWTRDEMQEFLRRWDALQKAAAEDPKASHELDESLKSLGLTPAKNRKRAGGDKSDSARDLRDSGTRTTAPKSYRDQFDSFRKGSR